MNYKIIVINTATRECIGNQLFPNLDAAAEWADANTDVDYSLVSYKNWKEELV